MASGWWAARWWGIVPMKALLDCAEYYLQIEDFSSEQVLELHIE